MINPTRINLLSLKEKARSVVNSIGILKAKRQALIREFIQTTEPFLRSREDIRKLYGRAVDELKVSLGREGSDYVGSLAAITSVDLKVDVTVNSIWGIEYREMVPSENPVRSPEERGYDYYATSPHLEECIATFERLVEAMLNIATFESKLKRLGEEIKITTRRIRVLEERVFPGIKADVKFISEYIAERERESYYRLKRFKEMKL